MRRTPRSAARRRPTTSPVWVSRAAQAPRRALPTRGASGRCPCTPPRRVWGLLRSSRWSTALRDRRTATTASYPRRRRGCARWTRATGGVGATRARWWDSTPYPRVPRGSSAATRPPSPPCPPRHPSAPRHSRPYAREARPPNLYLRREPYRASRSASRGHSGETVPPQPPQDWQEFALHNFSIAAEIRYLILPVFSMGIYFP